MLYNAKCEKEWITQGSNREQMTFHIGLFQEGLFTMKPFTKTGSKETARDNAVTWLLVSAQLWIRRDN